MYEDDEEDQTVYNVVVNHEEQYSIWAADRENPAGWRSVGKTGLKPECLAYIKEVWTDMRPLSLRKKMEEDAKRREELKKKGIDPDKADADQTAATEPEESLPVRLAQGSHPVEASLRPEKTVKELKESIDRGYVHIKFTKTRGGTELGVRLDRDKSDFTNADFEAGTGKIHVEGGLVLDYVPVRCIADIDLSTLAGTGHLDIVEK